MPEWKILLTDGLNEKGKSILDAEAHMDDRSGISPDELLKVAPEYDAIIVRGRTKLTSPILKAAANLKVIGRVGVGVDNIDLESAQKHGITVVNTPTASSNSVAELTIAMMFALARKISAADRSMKAGEWNKKQLDGIELSGKTLGIIGVGNIGALVADKASVLGMHVLACDIGCLDEHIESLGASPTGTGKICAQADFISLHIPMSEVNRGLINQRTIQQMKTGVYLINTARGGIIDESALLEALNSGKIAGAALDVFSTEPPANSQLVRHPNLIATPHIGAQTIEAQSRTSEHIAKEVLAALRGEALQWKVL
jgi:D-3-phosphoglycerate dehydrogenase